MHQLSSFRLVACQLLMACLFMPCLLRSCSSEAGHGEVSTQLIQIDCLSAYHGFLSAQVMMLVYGTWTTHSHSLTPSHTLTPPLPLTLSLHSLTHTHSPTRSLSLAHSPSLTHTPHSHHSLTVSLTHLCTWLIIIIIIIKYQIDCFMMNTSSFMICYW